MEASYLAEVERLFDKFGWPGLFIAGIVLVVIWMARRYAPKVDKVLDAHVVMVETITQNNSRQTDSFEVLARNRTSEAMPHVVKAIHRHVHDKPDQFSEAVREHLRDARSELE